MLNDIINLQSLNEFDKLNTDNPEKVILINFWATWCTQCKGFFEIFEKLQIEYKNDFIFAKVNVNENAAIPRQYQVTWIPTLIFIRNKELMKKIPGSANYDSLKIILEKIKNSER